MVYDIGDVLTGPISRVYPILVPDIGSHPTCPDIGSNEKHYIGSYDPISCHRVTQYRVKTRYRVWQGSRWQPWASAAAARRHHCLAAAAHWQPRRRQRRRRRRNPMPAGEAADDIATVPPASAGVWAGLDRRILSGSAALCAELENKTPLQSKPCELLHFKRNSAVGLSFWFQWSRHLKYIYQVQLSYVKNMLGIYTPNFAVICQVYVWYIPYI